MPALWDLLARIRTGCRFVDLTHAFHPEMPGAPFFPAEERIALHEIDRDGFRSEIYRHVGQWGTHVDAPAHFTVEGRTLDRIGVEEMLCPLVVLDISAAVEKDPDRCVGMADVHAWEERHGLIPNGAFVALRTGWSAWWPDLVALRNEDATGTCRTPGWSLEVLRWLCDERGLTACGHETFDTDAGVRGPSTGYECERFVLERGCYQIELLDGLHHVPEVGALVVAAFPKPLGGSGFPARAFAIVPESFAA